MKNEYDDCCIIYLFICTAIYYTSSQIVDIIINKSCSRHAYYEPSHNGPWTQPASHQLASTGIASTGINSREGSTCLHDTSMCHRVVEPPASVTRDKHCKVDTLQVKSPLVGHRDPKTPECILEDLDVLTRTPVPVLNAPTDG